MKHFLLLLTFILTLFYSSHSQEIERTYYQNGQIETEVRMEAGKPNGEFKSYYMDGKLYSRGHYKNGKLDGEWRSYYQNGQLGQVSYFSNDTSIGEHRKYNEEGNLIEKLIVDTINWTALIKTYYYDDKLHTIGEIGGDGKQIGKWKEFYNNDSSTVAHICTFVNGKKTGEFNSFYENGQLNHIGQYVDDLNEGEWKSYYEDGKLQEIRRFDNGKRTGEWISYFDDGKISEIGKYEKGQKTGEWRSYSNINSYYCLKQVSNYIDGQFNVFESAKNTFEELDIKMIKNDLIGERLYKTNFKSMLSFFWNFEDISEYLDLKIISNYKKKDQDVNKFEISWIIELDLLLQDASGKYIVRSAKLEYIFEEYGRRVRIITADKIEKTQLEHL